MTRKSTKAAKKALAKHDAAKVPRGAVPNATEPPYCRLTQSGRS
jgi:hypothetical protein